MLDAINDGSWQQAFGAAGEKLPEGDYGTIYNPDVPTWAVPPGDPRAGTTAETFTREDVVEVIAIHSEDDDGDSLAGVFRLRDGRFAAVTGWCDYSGWD